MVYGIGISHTTDVFGCDCWQFASHKEGWHQPIHWDIYITGYQTMKLVKNYFPFLIEYMHIHNWLVVYLPLWKILISQLGWLFPIYRKIKNVPNHQSHNLVCILSVGSTCEDSHRLAFLVLPPPAVADADPAWHWLRPPDRSCRWIENVTEKRKILAKTRIFMGY